MKTYKVVVTGPFNAGKTAFIRTVSDIEIVTTERKVTDAEVAAVKEETTVALDYGKTRMDEAVLHLYGTPGQSRFEVMWQILARDMDAFIVVIDSQDRNSLMEAKQIIRTFRKGNTRIPYMVIANKQDGESPMTAEEVAKLLGLPEDVPVVPCVAVNAESAKSALAQIVPLLK